MKMFHPRCKLMLVTEGGEGCRYYTPKFRGHVNGVKVQVVDTTGAGDAFCAGLLSQLAVVPSIIDDEPKLRNALTFANACGAITTTERGAIPALPDKDTVLRLIRKTPRLFGYLMICLLPNLFPVPVKYSISTKRVSCKVATAICKRWSIYFGLVDLIIYFLP